MTTSGIGVTIVPLQPLQPPPWQEPLMIVPPQQEEPWHDEPWQELPMRWKKPRIGPTVVPWQPEQPLQEPPAQSFQVLKPKQPAGRYVP
jgi:hypothetical protein